MSLSAGTRLGAYEILASIGAGGMGEVYRARDTKLKRDVALKVLHESFASDLERMARFQREAEVLAALNHPNIAQIYGIEERALVMELVEGETLPAGLPLEAALRYAKQIAEALEYAHERGVIHRDLKPANIKVTPEGAVKLLDFGLAKAIEGPTASGDDGSNSPTLTLGQATRVGTILGTAAYMAPEQARGKPVDKRCDIWAFGVVLYEMLTGERLFKGEDFAETLASVVKDQRDFGRAPPETRRLLERCLEKDAKNRLRDIGDAWAMLERTPAPQLDQPPSRQRQWLGWGAAALFFVIAAGVSGVHFLKSPPEAKLARFQVLPSEKSIFGNYLGVSPDGRKLAFSALVPGGRPALWVRPLDAIEPRLLAGTEGFDNGQAFWSPDSRYLAFGAEGKLKKVDSGGGPPQALCDVKSTVVGGGWNREGTIIFGSLAIGGVVWRVPATGGTASPLTVVDSAKETRHLLPSFLPDGRHFVYNRIFLDPAESGVYVGSLDAAPGEQSSQRVAVSRFGVHYVSTPGSSTGRLLFLRDFTLMAQPFDANRLELTGEAVPVAERLGASLNAGLFDASTNGVLVYRGGSSGPDLQITSYDRQGKPLHAAGPPGAYQMMALSPDGTQVAAMRSSQANYSDIWLIDVARNVPTRLTFDAANAIDPVWFPDGRRIVFQANGVGLKQKLSSGAGNEDMLLPGKEQLHPNDFSPDGRFLLYAVVDSKSKSDLWVLPMDGDRKPWPYLKTQFDEGQGQFSRDGRWVAYRSDESGKSEIYVQPFPATARGGGKWRVSSGGGTQPRWRRDGKGLYYISNERTVMTVDVTTSPTFKTGVPKAVFDAPFNPGAVNVFRWDVSADGKKFFVITTAPGAAAAPITVVLNWEAALNK